MLRLVLLCCLIVLVDAHQIVVFAVSDLVSESLNVLNMPLVSKMARTGVFTLTMRANDRVDSDESTWSAVFYGADGGAWGGQGVAPSDYGLMRSWLDMLEEDHGYGVVVFSDDPPSFPVGRKVRKVKDYDLVPDRSQLGLPGDVQNMVLVFHVGQLEAVGRSHGYRSINYYAYVSCIDRRFHKLAGALWGWEPQNTTFLLVVNRGGADYGHKNFKIGTLQVPFAAWGLGFAGHLEGHPTLTEQIAPTLFSIFNWSKPESWFAHPMPLTYARGVNRSSYNASHPHAPDEDAILCAVPRSVPHGHLVRSTLACVFVFVTAMLLFNILMSSPR